MRKKNKSYVYNFSLLTSNYSFICTSVPLCCFLRDGLFIKLSIIFSSLILELFSSLLVECSNLNVRNIAIIQILIVVLAIARLASCILNQIKSEQAECQVLLGLLFLCVPILPFVWRLANNLIERLEEIGYLYFQPLPSIFRYLQSSCMTRHIFFMFKLC